ncbi:hypothetical protein GCM10023194_66580 [Planotetraspora phitsanulokensis]|uniref:Uncharacterized protein n=1 Tax=Planotetraspora phitsanulokensis TaxID=575192 RepID=A0A8J3UJ66_9ACTN|nr:hypothetical protein Pph01_47830 [Planotetraspora phitsanulokensis]
MATGAVIAGDRLETSSPSSHGPPLGVGLVIAVEALAEATPENPSAPQAASATADISTRPVVREPEAELLLREIN